MSEANAYAIYEKIKQIISERTLIIIKPDGVKRGLIGKIIERFERPGFKIIAAKLILATKEQIDGHLPKSSDWLFEIGEKTLELFRNYGIDAKNLFEITKEDEVFENCYIGNFVRTWNYEFLSSGPVMVLVLQGPHAVKVVRKLIGSTFPCDADPGTIRGDFSINSPDLSALRKMSCENLIHASSSPEEAEREIKNWFSEEEIIN